MEWPYQTVLVRVVEALEKGVGECLRPWQIRRVAKADADARRPDRATGGNGPLTAQNRC